MPLGSQTQRAASPGATLVGPSQGTRLAAKTARARARSGAPNHCTVMRAEWVTPEKLSVFKSTMMPAL